MDTTTLRLASIGIDIGKEVFHIVGLSAHLVSRALRQLGHEPRIIPAIYVKPFVKGQKNDYNDAEAIAEASLRPNLRTVREKPQDRLDLQACHRVRSRLFSRR